MAICGAARTGCPARSPASSTASAAAWLSSPPTGPRCRRRSPAFTGMGIDGVGWGTAVTLDKVWVTSFNGKILVMDFDGHPVGKESDFPFKEKFGLMGIGVAANGDVWIADGSDNQLLYFPGGTDQGRTNRQGRRAEVALRHRHRPTEPRLGQQLSVGHRRAVPRGRSLQGGNLSGPGSASAASRWTPRAMFGSRATCPWTFPSTECSRRRVHHGAVSRSWAELL